MTYFMFLAIFLLTPILILIGAELLDKRHGRQLPSRLHHWPPYAAIGLHIVLAVVYTTPWDNYLVATNVWWYNEAMVTGFVIGWVPIEEYTFFVLQPILTGLWLLFLARRLSFEVDGEALRPSLRLYSLLFVGLIWLTAITILLSGWQPGVYFGLALGWLLLPVMLQLGFGADILWRYRRLVFWTIVPATIYLSLADALAIGSGTWVIDPAQSTGIFLGTLPIEELIFFLVTNILIVFGVTLLLAQESHERFALLRDQLFRSQKPNSDIG